MKRFCVMPVALSLSCPGAMAQAADQRAPIAPEMQCTADRAFSAAKTDAAAASLAPGIAARCFELSEACVEQPISLKRSCEASMIGVLREAAYDFIVLARKQR